MDLFDHHTHLNQRLDAMQAQLNRIETAITKLSTQEHKDMTVTSAALDALSTTVTANTSAIASAEATMSGLATALAAAIANAAANGATPAQLAQIQAMQTSLQNDDAGLAAAIVANTPAAP